MMRSLRYSGLVVLFLLVVGFGLPRGAKAASLYLSPSSGTYTVGQTIAVTVRLNAGGQPINASEATVTWTTNTLQYTGLSTSGTIFKYWPIDPVARSSSVMYSGGLPTPGYSGSAGTVLRLNFKAKAAGTATVQFSGGKILANDGNGTDVLQGLGTARFTVNSASSTPTSTPTQTPTVPSRPTPTVSSSSHPNQSVWYASGAVTLAWTKPSGLTGVGYIVTTDPGSTPAEAITTRTNTVTIALTNDGVWYFHLRGAYSSGWSTTTHYTIRFDHTAPAPFTVKITLPDGAADDAPTLTFGTTDALSGIAGYSVRIDGAAVEPAVSPMSLSTLAAGPHTAVVTATDRAGNRRESSASFTTTGYPSPTINSVTSPLLLFDSLKVQGLANAGDIVTIMLDGEAIGQVTVGQGVVTPPTDDTTIRLPWVFTTNRLIGPGAHRLTARAVGPQGQRSALTNEAGLYVTGQTVLFRGRPIATIALAPAVALVLLVILIANAFVLTRLWLSIRRLLRRETMAETEIEGLRQRLRRERISADDLDQQLGTIEAELSGVPAAPPRRRRRKKTA